MTGLSMLRRQQPIQKAGRTMKAESLIKMKRLEQDARRRIIERGKIEFRAEPELMSQLLDLAKERKTPLGKMIREWVQARLEQEVRNSPSQLDKIETKIDKLLLLRKQGKLKDVLLNGPSLAGMDLGRNIRP